MEYGKSVEGSVWLCFIVQEESTFRILRALRPTTFNSTTCIIAFFEVGETRDLKGLGTVLDGCKMTLSNIRILSQNKVKILCIISLSHCSNPRHTTLDESGSGCGFALLFAVKVGRYAGRKLMKIASLAGIDKIGHGVLLFLFDLIQYKRYINL